MTEPAVIIAQFVGDNAATTVETFTDTRVIFRVVIREDGDAGVQYFYGPGQRDYAVAEAAHFAAHPLRDTAWNRLCGIRPCPHSVAAPLDMSGRLS